MRSAWNWENIKLVSYFLIVKTRHDEVRFSWGQTTKGRVLPVVERRRGTDITIFGFIDGFIDERI